MLEVIFNFLIGLFMWIIGVIGQIIIYPFQILIVTLIPSFGQYISNALDFFTDTVFPIISFAKEMFLDFSNLPRPLWSIFIGFVFARWAIAPSVRAIKLIINIWKLKSGGKTE